MLTWDKDAIVVFSESEADVLALTKSGYRAGLLADIRKRDDLRGEHYLLTNVSNSREVGQKLSAAGLCPEWKISIVDLGGYSGLDQVFSVGGAAEVGRFIRSARSMYHDEEHAFLDLPPYEGQQSYCTGFSFLDDYLRWTIPEFIVLVGGYGSGKSALAQILACDFADKAGRELGYGSSICAWEDQDWRVKRNISRFAQTRERSDLRDGVDARELFLLEKVRHITLPPGSDRLIDWYLSRCELQIKRYNTRFFVFDPWNQFDHLKGPKESETDYVNKALRDLDNFAESNKVNMFLVTHVAGKSYSDDGKIKPFRIAQAQGSSHFGKICKRGICAMRSSQMAGGYDRMIVRFDKAKDEESMGKQGVVAMKFDPATMGLDHDPIATMEMEKEWKY
jgi:hypothetical protein